MAIVTFTIILGSVVASGVRGAPPRDRPQPAENDPAHQLLAAVAEHYRSLDAYQDEGRLSQFVRSDVGIQRGEAEKPFAFQRPNRIAVRFEPVAFLSDGARLVSVVGDRYHEAPAPERFHDDLLATNPAATHAFGGLGGIPTMALYRLLASEDPYHAILEGVERLVLEEDRTVNGVEAKALTLVPEVGPNLRLLIDPNTLFVIRVEIIPSPEALPPGVEVEEFSWTAGRITTQVDPAVFRHEPSRGASEVSSLAALIASEHDGPTPQDLVGRQAPDFSIEVLDQSGHQAELTKADLAGKVVLIDFWATWCAPCKRELPEIKDLVGRYARGPHADRVRIISLSVDRDPTSEEQAAFEELHGQAPPKAKETVERFLAAENLNVRLRDRPVGFVGIDPNQEAVRAFQVSAVPTIVLIAPDGVVRDARIGYDPRAIGELTYVIDALLESSQAARRD